MISRLKQTHWKLQATGGFSLIEIVIVIMAIGIFGSLAATMLANGATIYAETMEKKRFIAQARSSYWRLNRETGLQQKKSNYINSTQNMVNIATATGKTVHAIDEIDSIEDTDKPDEKNSDESDGGKVENNVKK